MGTAGEGPPPIDEPAPRGSGRLAGAPTELVGPRIVLRRYRWDDAEVLADTLARNRRHLAEWMPWAQDPPTEGSVHQFLTGAVDGFGHVSADYAITVGGGYVGGCGLMDRVGPGVLEIGYWLDRGHTGRGLVTEAVGLIRALAVGLDGVERIEIHCDQANHLSAAVARRSGFRLDRIEPDPVRAPGESGRSMIWVLDALACQGARSG